MVDISRLKASFVHPPKAEPTFVLEVLARAPAALPFAAAE